MWCVTHSFHVKLVQKCQSDTIMLYLIIFRDHSSGNGISLFFAVLNSATDQVTERPVILIRVAFVLCFNS